jgi:hypothetical protein
MGLHLERIKENKYSPFYRTRLKATKQQFMHTFTSVTVWYGVSAAKKP